MREIKFRAWDNRASKMVAVTDLRFISEYPENKNLPPHGIGINLDGDSHFDYILMQYTGLKGKNGVEIYEGDIIKWYGELMVIEWDDVFAGYNMVTPSGWGHTRFTAGDSEEAEGIGNIYENPELLEVIR